MYMKNCVILELFLVCIWYDTGWNLSWAAIKLKHSNNQSQSWVSGGRGEFLLPMPEGNYVWSAMEVWLTRKLWACSSFTRIYGSPINYSCGSYTVCIDNECTQISKWREGITHQRDNMDDKFTEDTFVWQGSESHGSKWNVTPNAHIPHITILKWQAIRITPITNDILMKIRTGVISVFYTKITFLSVVSLLEPMQSEEHAVWFVLTPHWGAPAGGGHWDRKSVV